MRYEIVDDSFRTASSSRRIPKPVDDPMIKDLIEGLTAKVPESEFKRGGYLTRTAKAYNSRLRSRAHPDERGWRVIWFEKIPSPGEIIGEE